MDEPTTRTTLERHGAEIRRSAQAVEQSTVELAGSADRRTQLAGDRTLLAAERTYAAWVRTALAALASGIGARALVRNVFPLWLGRVTGSILIIFAGFCLVAAVSRDVHRLRVNPRPDVKPVPRAILVTMNSFMLLVALAALVGIWVT